MKSDIDIRVTANVSELEGLNAVWNALLARSPESTPFLTHEWIRTWWRYFGNDRELKVLLLSKQGEVVGIVPLMRTEYKLGLAKIMALETIGAKDCNHVALIDPGHVEEVMAAVLAWAEQEVIDKGHIIRLYNVPEDSIFLALLPSLQERLPDSLAIKSRIVAKAPYIMLPDSGDDYFNNLGKRMRRRMRRSSRLLADAQLRISFHTCPEDELDSKLDRFFEIHQHRWNTVNITSTFSNPRIQAFYKDIAHQFMRREWLHFSLLYVDGEMASGEYAFVDGRKFYYFTPARDIRYEKYGIGHVHLMHLINEAIEKHLVEFDLMLGDEPYKYYWTKAARRYLEVVIGKDGIIGNARFRSLLFILSLREIRQYGLRELYSRFKIRRREKEEKKRMGLVD